MATDQTMSNLTKRILSALVLAVTTLGAFYLGSPYLDAYILLFAITLVGEWAWLCFKKSHAPVNRMNYCIVGSMYILVATFGLWKTIDDTSEQMTLLGMLILVWSSDIGAYVVGKVVGGPKLVPSISPGKTISGAIGGFLCALLVPHLVARFIPINLWPLLPLAFIAVLAQAGDLLESWIKRRLDVKDSSGLLPGHGGLLDRLDSLLPIGIVLAILHYLHSAQ